MTTGPVSHGHQFTLLCEGAADRNFVKALLEKRGGYPNFNFLDPQEHYGATNFKKMLDAIQGNQRSFSRLKGVLIIADSASSPDATMEKIRGQVRQDRSFHLYTGSNAGAVAARAAGGSVPAHITLLPDEATPGCLETLCVEALLGQYPWASACVEEYLGCDNIKPEFIHQKR